MTYNTCLHSINDQYGSVNAADYIRSHGKQLYDGMFYQLYKISGAYCRIKKGSNYIWTNSAFISHIQHYNCTAV